ncbi:PREDICTED: probable purine permease 14 [Camelina sativa]|uniref:Probable purine permease n=1 Tax=Camelina sativa TaxID=90675 RepID=A0ABM0TU87_CAMSA|nr:PREDICTED: probable purine permease 14 [Camelina sativa]
MGRDQLMQNNPQGVGKFVQIPIHNEEHSSTTLMNQTATLNRTSTIKWPTIIICVIFVITGQSVARLIENYYYLHSNNKRQGTWILSLLQVIGFPFLRIPLYFLLYTENLTKPRLSSHRSSLKYLTILYPCIGIDMVMQARLAAISKHEIPFNVFTLIYTSQLLFTPIFSFFINKIKFNRWIVISLVFSITAGSLTLYSSFPGEPNKDEVRYVRGVLYALFAAVIFSITLSSIKNIFETVISKRDVATHRNPSFASVVELIFFSSIAATVVSLAAVFISGEHHVIKRDVRVFGKKAYLGIMTVQVFAWQIYWVGLAGLVFAVSDVFSNVISVSTWPIVSVLTVLFFDFDKDKFDAFKGAALACAFLSVASYYYRLRQEKRNS